MERTFGQNLKELRERKGLTQEALMRRLELRRPAPISLWESRPNLPKPETIVRIAEALKCDPAELLRGVVTPYDILRQGSVAHLDPSAARSRRAG